MSLLLENEIMLDKDVLARVNALAELRERYGDNLVERFVNQCGYELEEHGTNEDEGSVSRCLSEDDHETLYGINHIRDGYAGWIWNADVAKFASLCKEEILRELKEFSFAGGENIGDVLQRICNQEDIISWLIEDCLDNDFGEVDGTDQVVSSCLGYWIGQELVSAYQDYYYEEVRKCE